MGNLPPIIVLCGGLGTRLGDLTKDKPKSMVEVAGKPFIAHQLELFKEKGIEEVILAVEHKKEQIIDFVGDGSRFGLEIKCCDTTLHNSVYSNEKYGSVTTAHTTIRGTGGALLKTLKEMNIDTRTVFVTYGDSYLDIDYEEIFKYFMIHFFADENTALMTTVSNEGKYKVGVYDGIVRFVIPSFGWQRGWVESGVYDGCIDYGLMIFPVKMMIEYQDYDENYPLDLTSVVTKLINNNVSVLDYRLFRTNPFHEIGSLQGLKETEKYILRRKNVNDTNNK